MADEKPDAEELTDEEWFAGHRYLISLGVIPDDELAYLYDPDRDPATVSPEDLVLPEVIL